MKVNEPILLGMGVVLIGPTLDALIPMGLTRGGSVFNVERDYRHIEADGDRGIVKGRTEIDVENAKLTVNALETFSATDMKKYYPGLSVTPDNETTPTKNKITSTLKISSGDYNFVRWVGKTKGGKPVTITVENAINFANLEWGLEDKNEVVPSLEFSATYDEATRDVAPWYVEIEE